MIEINDTEDFLNKLKSVFNALSSLKESGIDLDDTIFDDSMEAFLAQFKPTPKIPLPPNPWKTHVAFIARHMTNGTVVPATLATSRQSCALDLVEVVPLAKRNDYEIVPLSIDG